MMLALFGALVSLRFCSTVLLSGGPSTGLRTGRRWSVGQPRRSAKQTEPLPEAEAEAWVQGRALVAIIAVLRGVETGMRLRRNDAT
jgi:hypothetical protein